jgi:hypothetical protein
MSKEPKLRGTAHRRSGPYPLGELPHSLAIAIGKQIVHRLAVGNADITGDDFGVIFAKAINGEHKGKPLGIADVTWQSCAWSVKTVQDEQPLTQQRIRTISGRNSPVFSSGIEDPFADIQATGAAVLNVWNARVNESLNQYDDLRIFVLVRNMTTLEFTLIETEAARFVAANYFWKIQQRKGSGKNLIGSDKKTGNHCFTWQSHGSQFTVIHHVPASAYRFRINRHVQVIPEHQVLATIGFDETWIEPIMPLPETQNAEPVEKNQAV